MVDGIMNRYVEAGIFPDADSAKKAFQSSKRTIAEPVEIAKAVRFLASDEAGFMTGSETVVDGGVTAR